MRYFFSLFTFLLLVKIATAQVSAKATVDSTNMLLGDQMRLHLDVSQEQGVQLLPINPPVPKDSTIEFLAQSRWDTLQTGGTLRLRKDFIFMVWDSGYLRVPPIPVVYLQNGRQDTFFTNDIPIEVKMPTADTTLADIKPIIEEPANWQDYLWYIIGIGVLLLAIVLVLVLRKRKVRQNLPPPPPIILPPHEIALQKLEELKKQKLWQQGQVKEYHSELTYIVREYLENRFGILALEQTTDEILEQLRKSDFDRALSEKLTNLLQTADLVKFAKALPPADFHDQAMAYVEEFILETKPVATPAEETETKDVH